MDPTDRMGFPRGGKVVEAFRRLNTPASDATVDVGFQRVWKAVDVANDPRDRISLCYHTIFDLVRLTAWHAGDNHASKQSSVGLPPRRYLSLAPTPALAPTCRPYRVSDVPQDVCRRA